MGTWARDMDGEPSVSLDSQPGLAPAPAPASGSGARLASLARAVPWRAFVVSRLAVLWVAVVAAAWLRVPGAASSTLHDIPSLTHPFGDPAANAWLSPLAHWDAVWYLWIAHAGYGATASGAGPQAAFFPLYPLAVRALAGWSASPAALLVCAYGVSLGSFLVALALLRRLAALELGERGAGVAVLALAALPSGYVFGAPYSESLFLALSLGAFLAARRGRWAWAAALAAGASATRLAGVALVVPLVILYLYGPRTDRPPDRSGGGYRPRYRVRSDALWLALAPAGLAAFAGYLALRYGDGLAFVHLQQARSHHLGAPFSGVWAGVVAGVRGIAALWRGTPGVSRLALPGDPDVLELGVLVFAAVATVGALRRLPAAYGAYAIASLALPLSSSTRVTPLASLHRYVAVLFPLVMWLAVVCVERRLTRFVLALSSVGLVGLTALFATWHYVY